MASSSSVQFKKFLFNQVDDIAGNDKAHFIMGRASRQIKPLQRLRLIIQLRIHFISSLSGREALPPPPKLLIKDEFRCAEKIEAHLVLLVIGAMLPVQFAAEGFLSLFWLLYTFNALSEVKNWSKWHRMYTHTTSAFTQHTALFWMLSKFYFKIYAIKAVQSAVIITLWLLFCILRFVVKKGSVNAKQTRTTCINFFFWSKRTKRTKLQM